MRKNRQGTLFCHDPELLASYQQSLPKEYDSLIHQLLSDFDEREMLQYVQAVAKANIQIDYGASLNQPWLQASVNNLVSVYSLFKQQPLTATIIHQWHREITTAIPPAQYPRGNYRTVHAGLRTSHQWTYLAPVPEEIEGLMQQFIVEVNQLAKQQLQLTQLTYYAAQVHLLFVKIHPYSHGNGILGRLLEHWFLAQHIGAPAFAINLSHLYATHANIYNTALAIGATWELFHSNQHRWLPFLLLGVEAMSGIGFTAAATSHNYILYLQNIQLWIKGYERGDDSSEWLELTIRLDTPEGKWEASSACITTWELQYLAKWAHKLRNGHTEGIDFIEPCITLTPIQWDNHGGVIIEIWLSDMLKPDFATKNSYSFLVQLSYEDLIYVSGVLDGYTLIFN